MYLPNRELAFIPEEKITRYLLDISSERGRPKAIFFLECGFRLDDWEDLEYALYQHAQANEVAEIENRGERGIFYVIEGELLVPIGGTRFVRAVWNIPQEANIPRLVTAHTISRRRRHGNV